MPIWIQYILAAAALLAAIGVIWTKGIKPLFDALKLSQEMLPLLKQLTIEFKDTPQAFKVLDEIVGQFRTDSGSSLRDVVDRLEAAALENRNVIAENRQMAESLKVGVEASRLLAERDREQVSNLIMVLDRLAVKVDVMATGREYTTKLLEQIGAVVAIKPPIVAGPSKPPDLEVKVGDSDTLKVGESVVISRVEDKEKEKP